jgi:dipeptidyl aminopeptidase/acylaminoacyl peptidase
MKPADLALLRVPGAPTLAPDGRSAVVAVTRLDLDDDEYRSQLWLVPTDGRGLPRPLTLGWRDTEPRYSPDGRWLAFLRMAKGGRPQVAVLPVEGGELRVVTDHPLGAAGLVWSPDSTRLAYVVRVPEEGRYGTADGVTADKEAPRRINTLQYRLDNLGFTLDRWQHVFLVDPFAEDPAPEQLTSGDYDNEQPAWSPDGRRIVFSSRRHAGRDRDLVSDLYSIAVDGSDLRRLTDTTLSASHPAVSPDGGTVYFVGCELGESGRDFVGRNQGLYAVPADGTAPPRRLTDSETVHLADVSVPLVVGEDGVLVEVEHRGALELRRLGADGSMRVLLGGPRVVSGHAVTDGVLVATVVAPDSAGELVAVRDGDGERMLTTFGSELAKNVDPRPMEEITGTAPDGYPVHGWVVRPAGAGPHPVLLMIHGGPFAQYGWRLFDEAQVYAGAGYAVVMGNPRGSCGYGQAHGRHIIGDVGERSAADLLALLDAALTADDLDGERVGVLGGSHGGFMTAWLAARTDRFRAAIAERGVYALDSFVGSSDIGWCFADEMYGADPAEQVRQSPLTYVDDIDIPVLIIHSEHDWRCPVEQAQRLYVALARRGVPVELLLFPAESHELSRSGLPSHRIARFGAILDWWARHLQ